MQWPAGSGSRETAGRRRASHLSPSVCLRGCPAASGIRHNTIISISGREKPIGTMAIMSGITTTTAIMILLSLLLLLSRLPRERTHKNGRRFLSAWRRGRGFILSARGPPRHCPERPKMDIITILQYLLCASTRVCLVGRYVDTIIIIIIIPSSSDHIVQRVSQ